MEVVWPFTGLYVRKTSLGKDDAHARGAGQMIAFNGVVAVMKLIEFFTAIYVQHIGPASRAQNTIKFASGGFFVCHMRKGRKTDACWQEPAAQDVVSGLVPCAASGAPHASA